MRYNCRMPGLLLALAAVMGVLLLAAGDVRAVSEKEAQREIESIERALGFDRERERRLQAERRAIEKELADLDRQMVEAARRVQAQEAAVTGSEEKLRELVRQAEEVQADLGHRREQMIGTLSALQRLAQRPPEALLAMPAEPVDTVRTAILLGAIVPPLEREAERLRNELTQLAELRAETKLERDRLAKALEGLRRERASLARLAARKKLLRDRAAAESRDVAARLDALSHEARDLRELLERLEAERRAEEARRRAEAEERRKRLEEARRRRAAAEAARRSRSEQEAARAAERAAERAAAEATRRARPDPPTTGPLALVHPAHGRIVRGYGDGSGPRSRGITFETRENAQVVAPRAGRIAYAGPFRGYGLLLIIEHGGGYHSLLTGFSRIDAAPGQQVVAGEPVGVVGAAGQERPSLYMELRRNGRPINPMPWLAAQKG